MEPGCTKGEGIVCICHFELSGPFAGQARFNLILSEARALRSFT
ncbi:hypothetical protein OHAE_4437 [Ochrobactrum soli]|uniref:Uncharacterized protein n=1 Tax=Ochrobactrum soli TaxID=2448455 RepID=A0A2P9HC44_9HYPH|nr:hypothetical protein OHAE_4437 [[Ochrobactrum] soli]